MKNNLEPKTHLPVVTPIVGVLAPANTQPACVPDLVAQQALASPAAIAVTCGSETLTYAELENRSNQLARFLRALGVGPEQVVGLYLDRSPSMVIAALAILKAGSAYLPLPPDSPRERLEFMLRDADVAAVVTHSDLAAHLPSNGHRVVAIDRDSGEIAKQSPLPLAHMVSEGSLAYVIYTSGSTGQPKGVEILHRGLSNLVSWHLRAFGVTATDRASHLAALGFDAAVWELWPYLVAGASVHLAPEALRQDPVGLCEWLVKERITIGFMATPLAERLLLLQWPKQTALRILLTGADTLHHRPAANLPFILVNNYGPTECTVVATSGAVPPGESNRAPSIGRPIDNLQAYVLDEEMKEVAAGVAGELYLGGAGVGRGYRNHPDLTAQKFVPNPFSEDSSDRLYRTGDLVRCLPSGEVEFLGRSDDQLKIRGYRIEPSEIVRVLDEYPGVETSAVVARERDSREKSLVAYLVLAASANVTATQLREYVSKQLPTYMVPASFVRVNALPVTANGKVDRTALPAPDAANSLVDEEFIAPRTLVEQRLAAILSHLLNVKVVGVNDNFFLLGGHSLLGTQLLTRISQNFGVELSLLSLFDHPTLAGMSEEIEKLILAKLEDAEPAQVWPSQPGGTN
ncbi:MAG: amino acid adenylation domain-containing protein [Acidobacteriia bacterium]|nr:amino acid adenylation domain-containing protein [Terriglobia bacterium]